MLRSKQLLKLQLAIAILKLYLCFKQSNDAGTNFFPAKNTDFEIFSA